MTVRAQESENQSVSLCMIVKDEEANLEAAIASVRPLVDEIIVCDTGSTDGTVGLAESLGATVVPFVWCDDFSAARNAALDAVTSDWVLVLDADEVLASVGRDDLRALLDDPAAAGLEVRMRSERGRQVEEFSLVRLFRNDPAVRYCYPVHEQIVPALNSWAEPKEMVIKASGLVIEHSGYDPQARAAKRPRNQRLLARALELHPDEPYLHFQAGAEAVSVFGGEVLPVAGMLAAKSHLERAWELVKTGEANRPIHENGPWLADLVALLGSARQLSGDLPGALEVLQAGPENHDRLAYLLALTEIEAGQKTEPAIPLDQGRQSRVLGDLALSRGEYAAAAGHFNELKLDAELGTFGWLGLAQCALAADDRRQVLAAVIQATKASEWNWRAWQLGAELLSEMGLDEQATVWQATLRKQFPDLEAGGAA